MRLIAVFKADLDMMMRIQSIPPQVRGHVDQFRWDRIIEKHEGPEDWRYLLKDDYVDFLQVDGFDVLLPVDKQNHVNITIPRASSQRMVKR